MDQIYAQLSDWLSPIRGRIMIGFLLIVGMYFVLSFGEQAWRAQELESDVAERRAEIAELELKRASLEDQLTTYSSEKYDTYVAQIARRDLNLAYPGETVMLVRWNPPVQQTADTEPEPTPEAKPANWERWLAFVNRSD